MDFTPRKFFNFKTKYCSILKRAKVKDGSNERFSQNRHQSKRTCLSNSQALANTHSRLTETTSFITLLTLTHAAYERCLRHEFERARFP